MEIDYNAIAARLERKSEFKRFRYDIPHPWEEGYVYNPRDFEREYHRFPQSWKGVSPLVLLARLVRGEGKLPHRTDCPKCNEVRKMRKDAKGIR